MYQITLKQKKKYCWNKIEGLTLRDINIDRTEEYILASFLTNPSSISVYRTQIAPEAFFGNKRHFICKAIFNRFDDKSGIDLAFISEDAASLLHQDQDYDFSMILVYLEKLVDNFYSNFELLEEKVKDLNKRYCLRDAQKVAGQIMKLSEEDLAPDQLIEKVRTLIYGMKANFIDSGKQTDTIGNVAYEILRRAERIKNKEEKPDVVFSQYRKFHNEVGPFYAGDFIVLGAVSSMGKTTIALNLLKGIAESGHKVLIESIEMSKEKITEKFLAMETRVNNKFIPLGNVSEEQKKNLNMAAVNFKNLPITINNAQRLTVAKVERDIHLHKPKIIMIDFLQKMYWRGREKRHAMEQICDELFAIGKETGTIILILSQLVGKTIESRPLKDRRPQMYDLKEAGGITEDADLIIMLFNKAYYDAKATVQERRALEVIVRKHRMGARNKTFMGDFQQETSFLSRLV